LGRGSSGRAHACLVSVRPQVQTLVLFKKRKKEIEDTNKWKYILCLQISLIQLKCPHYPKRSIDLMQSLSKFQWFFYRNRKIILKFVWNHKWLWVAKAILSKKNKAGSITLPDLKIYSKPVVIKIAWPSQTLNQWNRMDSPETNPFIYGQLIF
jgi:hypothetical protein